jgi:hypothetical protein
MGRDNDIANRLRGAGLSVVEVDGWTSRGSSDFNPRGSVNHHTAGPKDGNIPSLNTLIYGRSDLPGPLCNVAQARNNDVYVIASGRANHAGSGGWRGLSGNSSVYGLEIEHTGTSSEAWTADRVEVAARVHAALIRGRFGAEMVCQHKEWAPDRKIDAYQSNGETFRSRVAHYLADPLPAPPDAGPTPQERYAMFCLVQPPSGGVYRFDGAAMVGVPNPEILSGDQIQLARLGLNADVWQVSREWFDSWPIARP